MSTPKITGVTARAVNVPLEYPLRTSVALISTTPLVLIDLYTDAGVTGRSYLFAYTPLALRATTEAVRALGQAIEGQALAPVDIDKMLAGRLRLLGRSGLMMMACSGLDMALWDARARHLGQPLVTLLGGEPRPVPAYDSHGLDGVEIGVQRAEKAAKAGFKAIKTKVGYPTLEEDLRVVRALRDAVGPGVEIMVDFNQGLSVPEAVRRIHVLQDEGLAWFEEPTVQEDLRGYAQIRDKVRAPIQMGENWWGIEDMQKALTAGACDLAMPDVMKIGGVTGWQRAAALAQSHGIPMSSHIFPEISAHLMRVTGTAHWLERMDLAGPVLAKPQEFVDGAAVLTDEPGSGIEWNETAIGQWSV